MRTQGIEIFFLCSFRIKVLSSESEYNDETAYIDSNIKYTMRLLTGSLVRVKWGICIPKPKLLAVDIIEFFKP